MPKAAPWIRRRDGIILEAAAMNTAMTARADARSLEVAKAKVRIPAPTIKAISKAYFEI
jgi:hypothetical protein